MAISSDNSYTPRTKEEQIKEILKCGRDPNYFILKYVKIQHPKKGLIPCKMYPFQEDCIRQFEQHRLNVVVKARQLGLSTVTAAYALWYALFQKDKNVLVIATKLSTAINFIKKVKIALQSLPLWLQQLSSYTTTVQSIKFSNRSVITAIPTSEDAGRGEAISLLIIDECAIIRDFDKLWTGLSPTISTGGNAILLSTPYGVGGQYYQIWVEAEAGISDFNPIRLPWYVHPEHDENWFQEECRRLNNSKKKISQELLCEFLTSGDTFLQIEDFDYLRKIIDSHTDLIKKSGSDHGIWTWKDSHPGHEYIISADVSRGDSNDYSTCHVLDRSTWEVVCEYKGKIQPDKFAELLIDLGKKYNNALLCPENNTFGYTTCSKLKESKYPNLYYEKKNLNEFDYSLSTDNNKIPGFNTQQKSRIQILTKLEEVIRNKVLKVYSQRFYEEVKSFVWNGEKAQASRGSNDDLVMSLAIGVWLLDSLDGQSVSDTSSIMSLVKAMSVTKRDQTNTSMNVVNEVKPPAQKIYNGLSSTTSNNIQSNNPNMLNYNFNWLFR